MATQSTPEVKPALLFMPDISGFTKFVNETEIIHSQHIVQELLEILIDSNQMNLQVNEIEGDAILFFRPGQKPALAELLGQVETMYINFHRHLQLYDHQRICQCGACKSAIDLKLKVITHYGDIAQYSVKDHKKLFGKDVIVIHRLLKNNIDSDEYILMTKPVLSQPTVNAGPSWFSASEGTGVYDSGEVQYNYAFLEDLMKQVPPPELPQIRLSSSASISFADEAVVKGSMDKIFEAIFDLEKRTKWMAGVRGVELLHHEMINRKGSEHICIVKAKNNPIIVTESATIQKDRMELVEMSKNGMGGCRYTLKSDTPGLTRVIIEVLVSKNPLVRLMFGLTMKKNYKKGIRQSLVNLGKYFSEPVQTGREKSLATA